MTGSIGSDLLTDSRKTVNSVVYIIFFSIGAKILGFLREILIASKFGAGFETDTFFIALSIVSLGAMGLKRAISTTLIPILSVVAEKEGKSGKCKHVSNVLNIFMLISALMVIIGILLAPQIASLVAIGFKGSQQDFLVKLIRIGLPAIIFSCMVGIFRGFLQSESKFKEYAVSNLPFNLTYIFYLIVLSGYFGIEGLMVASVIAIVFQVFIQIPGLIKSGYRYSKGILLNDIYVGKMIELMPPVIVMTVMSDINVVIDKTLASTLAAGSVSALNYGNKLESLIIGVFISSITTVIYPIMSKEAARDNIKGLKIELRKGFNSIILITVPATVALIILAEPIVVLAFKRGAFDFKAVQLTIGALVFYSLGIVGLSTRTLLSRVYYSIQDTKSPMINSLISVVLNIAFNLILIRPMGHMGLALGTSLAATITTIYMLFDLNKKVGSLDIASYLKCFVKSASASLIMGVLIYSIFKILNSVTSGTWFTDFLILSTTGLVGLIVYLSLIHMLKVEEFNWLYKSVVQKIKVKISIRKNRRKPD